MRDETARRLSLLTSEFYASVSASFSETRDAPWSGWTQVMEEAGLSAPLSSSPRVADVACGNLRFERFLADVLAPEAVTPTIDAYVYDNCDDLALVDAIPGVVTHFTHVDVAETLYAGKSLRALLGACSCDMAVCFGFLHHLPLQEHRRQMVQALVGCVAPGGAVALSFWQFSKSERLLKKARLATEREAPLLGLDDLGPNDYLLGWQERHDVLRYCHDFTEEEVDDLAVAAGSAAREVARFSADGKSGNLNRYLVLRRCSERTDEVRLS